MTSKQRAYLRSLANKTDAIIQIGKNGITPELTVSLDVALEARELVKIGLLENTVIDVKEAADILHERTRSEVVQVIGKKIVLYRKSKTKPKIELPPEK